MFTLQRLIKSADRESNVEGILRARRAGLLSFAVLLYGVHSLHTKHPERLSAVQGRYQLTASDDPDTHGDVIRFKRIKVK